MKQRMARVPVLGAALRVQERYVVDAADQLAAAIGFFAFLSLFPLMIIALGVTGQVLAGRPDLQGDVIEGIIGAVPGFDAVSGGSEIGKVVDSIVANRGTLGLIGGVTLILSGLRVVNAAMTATTKVFHLPPPKGAAKVKGRQLGAMAVLGVLLLLSTSAGALVGATGLPLPGVVRGLAIPLLSAGLDVVVFFVAYRMLAFGEAPAPRFLLPGAVFAAVGWTALKIVGSTFVSRQIASANAVYGPLAGVVALLLLLYLAGRLYLYGAELIAMRAAIPLAAPPDTVLLADLVGPGPAAHDGDGDATPSAGEAGIEPAARPASQVLHVAPGSLGPGDPSPAVSARTRARLAELDAQRAADEERERAGLRPRS